jgi:hypothetical protein
VVHALRHRRLLVLPCRVVVSPLAPRVHPARHFCLTSHNIACHTPRPSSTSLCTLLLLLLPYSPIWKHHNMLLLSPSLLGGCGWNGKPLELFLCTAIERPRVHYVPKRAKKYRKQSSSKPHEQICVRVPPKQRTNPGHLPPRPPCYAPSSRSCVCAISQIMRRRKYGMSFCEKCSSAPRESISRNVHVNTPQSYPFSCRGVVCVRWDV